MLSMVSQFDFSRWDPRLGVVTEDITQLEKQHQIMPWTAAFVVSGAPKVAQAKAQRIKSALKSIADVKVISLTRLIKVNNLLENAMPLFKRSTRYLRFQEQISQFTRAMIMFEGNPDPMILKGCYWRNQRSPEMENTDPIEDDCGFYWIAPTLPMLGEEVNSCVAQTEKLFQEYGFEFGITLTSVTAHMCQAIFSLYYDVSVPEEQQRAKVLIHRLRRLYTENKWQCYRRAVDEMPFSLSQELDQDAIELKGKIKHALDPHNLINAGRYQTASPKGSQIC